MKDTETYACLNEALSGLNAARDNAYAEDVGSDIADEIQFAMDHVLIAMNIMETNEEDD